jgi:hypothetical protein
VRLTKSPERYAAMREHRREAMYEAMLARGETEWRKGDRVRVYRGRGGWKLLAPNDDARDYDVEHYVRALKDNYATRMLRALTSDDFESVFADPDQPSLFEPDLAALRPILRRLEAEIHA